MVVALGVIQIATLMRIHRVLQRGIDLRTHLPDWRGSRNCAMALLEASAAAARARVVARNALAARKGRLAALAERSRLEAVGRHSEDRARDRERRRPLPQRDAIAHQLRELGRA